MLDADSSHRRDVEQVLILRRSIEYFPVRCISTQNPIHESRIEIVEKFEAEAQLRRLERPIIPPIIGTGGQQLRAVAPRSVLVQIVKGKPTRRVTVATDSGLRLWAQTIDVKLHRIGRVYEESLLDGVEAFIMLKATKTTLRQINSTLGSPSARKRLRKMRGALEMQRDYIQALNDMYHDQRIAIVRSALNRAAVERFYEECSRTPSMCKEIFRAKSEEEEFEEKP